MTQSNLPPKILVVANDASIAGGLVQPLSRYNVKVEKAVDYESGLYLFNQQLFDVVLVDTELDPIPGLALVQKWRDHESSERRCCGFIMMSGNKATGLNEGLLRELGDLEKINKPFSVVQILPYLSRALATKRRLLAIYELQSKVLNYYEKTGEFDKAVQQVKSRLGDLGAKGIDMLVDLYEKSENFEAALALVNPLLEKDPNNIKLLNSKGRLLMRLGRFEDAKEVMEKADEQAPQNIERVNEMAVMYLETQEPDKAVKKFNEILKLSPENPDMKFDMFSQLFDRGYDQQAVEFGKSTATPKEIVRHYNNKGVVLSKTGENQNAIDEYQRAIRFYPAFKQNYRIHYNIALAKLKTKSRASYEEAAESLKKCLELDPSFEKAKKTLETIEGALSKKAS